MQNKSGLLKIVGFVGIAVIIGVGLGWFASRPKTAAHRPVAADESTAPTAANARKSAAAAKPVEEPVEISIAAMPAAPAAAPAQMDWGDKVSDILAADTEIENKYKEMLKLYPDLPDDGKLEVAQHLNNLVPDDDYAQMGKILIDPKVPGPVAEAILFDLFNRPNSLKLPLMLQVARTPGHPAAEKAQADLALLLEEDHGTDWSKWEQTMQDYLKNNPD
ncbi:MAG: hypothetical protein NTZ16_09590 [Verrucomicrobia bacterium]|nr:hypothetical protein [Verrucomicrobiota bacterium]